MKTLLVEFAFFAIVLLAAQEYKVTISTDHPNGFYQKGETVSISANIQKNGKPLPDEDKIRLRFSFQTVHLSEETVSAKNGVLVIRKTPDRAGSYLLQIAPLKADGNSGIKYPPTVGFVINPEKILPCAECRPADFDAWWDGELAKLNAIPMEVIRKDWKWSERDKKNMETRGWFRMSVEKTKNYDVRIRCVGDQWVAGGLSIPRKPGKYPAQIQFYGVGFGPGVAAAHAANMSNMIIFTINAHGLKKDESWEKDYPNYIKRLTARYPIIGIGQGRDKWYYHDCFLRAARAVQYIKTLPEWDGKIIIVNGGSQGAAQSIAAAALDPAVSHCVLAIPAMCDFSGDKSSPARRMAWPVLMNNGKKPVFPEAGYYDCVNFAPRIRAKSVTVIIGLSDHLVTPTGPLAFYNTLPQSVQKKIIALPAVGHNGGLTFPHQAKAIGEARRTSTAKK